MENITLPNQITTNEIEENHSEIVVSPCYPGYGTTLGNALRRVLLSSLPGGAITAVKIKGVDHEFSSLENVKEDIVEIILNLKQVTLKIHSDEPQELTLKVKGDKKVTAGDFDKNADVEITNPKLHLATITDKNTEFEMSVMVNTGMGYVPVENREKEKLDVGYISIDAIYTPVKNVNFKSEHVRVGKQTNYDKLTLDIITDGTISPEEAFKASANILVDHFSLLNNTDFSGTPEDLKEEEAVEEVVEEVKEEGEKEEVKEEKE